MYVEGRAQRVRKRQKNDMDGEMDCALRKCRVSILASIDIYIYISDHFNSFIEYVHAF
jgi:hypothetical protein